MTMTPISKSSLSIGTATCDRAPPCSAKKPGTASAVLSALWLTCFVRKTWSIAVPGVGLNGPRLVCASSNALGVLNCATGRRFSPSKRNSVPKLALHMLVACTRIIRNTNSRSPGDVEIRRNISEFAVSRSSASSRSRRRRSDSLSARTVVALRRFGIALRLRAFASLLLALERRRIAHPKGLGLRRLSKSITAGICDRRNALFDDLVGKRQQPVRNSDSQYPGRFAVDNKFNFRGLLDRQIGWFLTFQDTCGVHTDDTVRLGDTGPIAHQATCDCKVWILVDARYRVLIRKRGEFYNATGEKCIVSNQQRTGSYFIRFCKRRNEFFLDACLQSMHLNAQAISCGLQFANQRPRGRSSWVDENGDVRCAGHQLVQQFQPFCSRRGVKRCYARQVAARTGKAFNNSKLHRIRTDKENYWCSPSH